MCPADDFDPIHRWVADRDLDALSAASPEAVAAAAESMAGESEAEYPAIDEDRLMSTGVALRNAGHGTVDHTIVDWLRSRPTNPRLDIASVILRGLWLPGGGTTIDPAHVDTLLSARRAAPAADEADDSSLLTLAEALRSALPADTRVRVLEELRRALLTPHANPSVRPLLERALATGQ
jgi:hypothetical protein